jgi:hypothetical protein
MPRISTRINPIDRRVDLLFPEHFGPQARSQALAQFARVELGKAQEQNRKVLGRTPPHDTFVDGSRSDNLEAVKPDGRIEFEFTVLEQTFEWIREMLRQNSPVGTPPKDPHPGLYRDSHQFIADGRLVEPGQPTPPAREYVFVNTVPYARKIERGQGGAKAVYHVVAEMAQRRFGNVARIKFGFSAPLFGGIEEWAGRTRMKSKSKGSRREEWLRRQPAIFVTME